MSLTGNTLFRTDCVEKNVHIVVKLSHFEFHVMKWGYTVLYCAEKSSCSWEEHWFTTIKITGRGIPHVTVTSDPRYNEENARAGWLLEKLKIRGYHKTSAGEFSFVGNVCVWQLTCHHFLPGAFLVPYLFMLLVLGIPLLYMELTVGQYTRRGPVHALAIVCPLLKGTLWHKWNIHVHEKLRIRHWSDC